MGHGKWYEVTGLLGKTLSNRYHVLDKIGEGGMALVYKAKDTLLGRLVAVKVLRAQYAGDHEFVERFRREAQAAASLSHANVVNIYDVGQEDGVDFIVMEYVEGRNLKDVIREERIALATAVHIAQQVAMALDHAHRHHLVHRDIKPHNILLTEDNQVKVTDFGIALAASYSELTQTGFVVGTAQYFSPEQAKGGMATKQSDLYSLGVLLYEMVTGRLPFTGDTPVAIALQHVQDPIRPPQELNPAIPRELNRIIMKALAKDLGERYQTAREMVQDLQTLAVSLDKGTSGQILPPAEGETALIRPVEEDTGRTMIRKMEGEETAARREQRQAKRRRKKRMRYVLLFSMLFLAAIVWGASKLPELIFPQEVVVPNVVGRTQSQARRLLEENGLKLAVDREVYSSEAPAGQVMKQEPEANRRVKMYRTVFVTISKGPRLIEVPPLVGLSVRDARLRISQAGLEVGKETPVIGSDVPIDHVVAQDPEPGSYLEEGLPVDISVSSERATEENLNVPDFRNMTLDAAKQRLSELGLVLGNVWGDTSFSIPQWRIISQNPAPGTAVSAGEGIDFVYSLGPPGTQQTEASPGIQDESREGGLPQTGEDLAEEDQSEEPPEGEPGFDDENGVADEDETQLRREIEGPQTEDSLPLPELIPEDNEDLQSPTGAAGRYAIEEDPTQWRQADVQVNVSPGPQQEVVIVVIDTLGAREVYRGMHKGGTVVSRRVVGKGDTARIQVYIGNSLVTEKAFP